MKINVREILARRDAREKKADREIDTDVSEIKTLVQEKKTTANPADDKEALQKQLWEELAQIKRNRGKHSTRTAYLVDEVVSKLRGEDPALADLFFKGDLCNAEIKEHYALLQSYTEQAIEVYDKIRHLESFGKLPAPKENLPPITSEEEKAIHYEIRRLDDMIYKTKKKIDSTSLNGKKSSKLAEWKEKVALAEARRDDLKEKLKRKQHEARERTHSE